MNRMDTADSTGQLRLGVVVPLANEERTIESLLDAITAHLQEDDRIFCVLDKVSKDSTREKVEDYSLRDSRVRCVWAPENRCVVDAYFRGYREALDADCRWILEMDGGFSHHPDEIPKFIAAMEAGASFAAGSRFASGGAHQGSLYRSLLSWAGTFLTNRFLDTEMKDMTSGFECFSHAALRHVLDRGVESRYHFFQTEIRYMLRDWNWVEIPITYSNPSPGVGLAPIREALALLWKLSRQQDHAAPSHDHRAAPLHRSHHHPGSDALHGKTGPDGDPGGVDRHRGRRPERALPIPPRSV